MISLYKDKIRQEQNHPNHMNHKNHSSDGVVVKVSVRNKQPLVQKNLVEWHALEIDFENKSIDYFLKQ